MNKLSTQRRVQVISALVEGIGINAVSRMTGVTKNAILKLLADVGNACAIYQHNAFRNLSCKRIECDEIWSFCFAKQKNVREEQQGVFGYGDVYTWVAIDADTKLVPSWLVGRRDGVCAMEFIKDLASRLANRVQLTTDGHKAYLNAIEETFGSEIDYAMLIKVYGGEQSEVRYSPAECLGTMKERITGNPDRELVSTSFVERQNLTMRMSMRRFTRLTNAHSKKIENHIHAISLHYMYYNFCRIHQSLRCSPAMAANISKKLWSIEDIVALLD
jgi:transposase-like protein